MSFVIYSKICLRNEFQMQVNRDMIGLNVLLTVYNEARGDTLG
jgi:hypothetical protein